MTCVFIYYLGIFMLNDQGTVDILNLDAKPQMCVYEMPSSMFHCIFNRQQKQHKT